MKPKALKASKQSQSALFTMYKSQIENLDTLASNIKSKSDLLTVLILEKAIEKSLEDTHDLLSIKGIKTLRTQIRWASQSYLHSEFYGRNPNKQYQLAYLFTNHSKVQLDWVTTKDPQGLYDFVS